MQDDLPMKRWTADHAADVARRFCDSELARAWDLVGPLLRRAAIDSIVLDEMRIADSVDSTIPMTATDVVDFRERVELALALGVRPPHSRMPKRSYRVDDQDTSVATLLTYRIADRASARRRAAS